ncbi:zinc finger domain-containing protein [Halorubrum depositum]|uniref:zinc finger domain-containing protein n=1 Tax=Halorubrum depositum TaxID=2583992 RepID=UPI0011A37DFA|nr:zinc finger domain-containing protein [Halorubrum depositum]
MSHRDDLREAADALGGSIVVCGLGAYADRLARAEFRDARYASAAELLAETPPAGERSAVPAAADASPPAAVVVALDPDDLGEDDGASESLRALGGLDAFAVAVVPAAAADGDALSAVRDSVDAVLLAEGDAVEAAIRAFLATVQEPGFVNLDLTDAETVLSAGVAALGTGTADRDAPGDAVASAFDGLPEGVDATDASAVLVDVVVDPETSIAAATDVIAAVRERIGADANVIWGGAVDEAAAAELAVRLVVAGVRHAPPLAAGDPCPRCGAPLSAYEFGARETLSCDACGYSGIAVRRG